MKPRKPKELKTGLGTTIARVDDRNAYVGFEDREMCLVPQNAKTLRNWLNRYITWAEAKKGERANG